MPDDDRNHDDDETMQRINQANRAAGGIVMMPEEWAANAALADELNRNMFVELPYDNNLIAQRMAAWRMSWFMHADGERTVDNRWCPAYDEAGLPPLGQLYALVYSSGNEVIPLQHFEQYKEVAKTLLGDVTQCHARLTVDCFTALPATKLLAVKRGDFICLFKMCSSCRKALETLTVDSPEYTGISEHWIDEREPPSPDDGYDDVFGWKL
jgi:hypothetical protein